MVIKTFEKVLTPQVQRKLLELMVAIWLITMGLGIGMFARQLSLSNELHAQADRNSQAISALCTTRSGFLNTLNYAGDMIQANFDNGTYARLQRLGVISEDNVDAARKSLHSYRHTAEQLRNAAGPCHNVGKRGE